MKTHAIIENKFSHTITMDTSWYQDFIEKLGAELINPRQLIFPAAIASGCSYFIEIMPGLMVLIVDFTFQANIEFTKLASTGDFCIAYYDLSDHISIHHVNDTRHKVGYSSKLGMGIVDASLKSSYKPPIQERAYSFRLLISKTLLRQYLGNTLPAALAEKAFKGNKNTIFFYSHIDSRTRIQLLKLKERNYQEASFELFLKATALGAFGSLIERMSESEAVLGKLSEIEVERVMHTQLYLMEQLLEKFPGTDVLLQMAGMSLTKYTKLFKKLFKCCPKAFFLSEKLLLAQELLKSGNFKNINEVAYELSYNSPAYFSTIYKKRFGKLPHTDFICSKD